SQLRDGLIRCEFAGLEPVQDLPAPRLGAAITGGWCSVSIPRGLVTEGADHFVQTATHRGIRDGQLALHVPDHAAVPEKDVDESELLAAEPVELGQVENAL